MFAGIIIYRFEAINDQFSKLFIYQVVSNCCRMNFRINDNQPQLVKNIKLLI